MNTDTTYINKKNDEVEYLVDNSYSSESDNDVGGKETSNIITIKDATDDEDMDDFNSDQSEDDPNFVGQKYDKFIADEDLSMSDSTPASPFRKGQVPSSQKKDAHLADTNLLSVSNRITPYKNSRYPKRLKPPVTGDASDGKLL